MLGYSPARKAHLGEQPRLIIDSFQCFYFNIAKEGGASGGKAGEADADYSREAWNHMSESKVEKSLQNLFDKVKN